MITPSKYDTRLIINQIKFLLIARHKVYEVLPADKNQYRILLQWNSKPGIDFLTFEGELKTSRVMVASEYQTNFENSLIKSEIKFEIEIENVDEILKREKNERMRARARKTQINGKPNFSLYCTFEEMETYLHRLAKLYPTIMKLEVIGHSIERRNI